MGVLDPQRSAVTWRTEGRRPGSLENNGFSPRRVLGGGLVGGGTGFGSWPGGRTAWTWTWCPLELDPHRPCRGPGAGAGPSLRARSRLLGPLPRPSFWPCAHRHGRPLISGPASPTPLPAAHPEFSLEPGPPFPSHSTVLSMPELCLAVCIRIHHLCSQLSYTHPSINASSHHLFSFFKVILSRYD